MDKKNTILGILCLLGAAALFVWNAKNQPVRVPSETTPAETLAEQSDNDSGLADSTEVVSPPELVAADPDPVIPSETVEVADAAKATPDQEQIFTLENELIRIEFTNFGGAIRSVELKEYAEHKDSNERYTFNAYGARPMLELDLPGIQGEEADYLYSFEQVSREEIHFTRKLTNGLTVTRRYILEPDADGDAQYNLRVINDFANASTSNMLLKDFDLHLGTMEPALLGGGSLLGGYLNLGYYEDEDANFITSTKFIKSNGFLGIGGNKTPPESITESTNFSWVSLKNQFFTTIITPDTIGKQVTLRPVKLDLINDRGDNVVAIDGSARFGLDSLAVGQVESVGMSLYVGPKEIFRLQSMDRNQEAVMQMGWFSWVSKFMLLGLKTLHNWLPGKENWGFAIILITILLKILFWPLTQFASRSAKKMAKIQGPMKEIQEKYKDNPQKKNEAMLRLYREYKVNPAAGCLPMLIQFPIFIGFFYMLRTSSELRFAEFLWIADLSQPEKLIHWGVSLPVLGQYFNLLPLLMGVTMFFQMKMTPTAGSAEQQKIMKFMPIMMVVMLYNFSSGLCLYWTVQNLMTILQQTITNRMKDPEEKEPAAQVVSTQQENPLIRKKPKRKPKQKNS